MIFVVIILCIVILVLWYQVQTFEKRIQNLESRLSDNSYAQTTRSRKVDIPAKEEDSVIDGSSSKEKKSVAARSGHAEPVAVKNIERVASKGSESKQKIYVEEKKPQKKKDSPKHPILILLEKQLIENWTGIVGSAILVMGVGFVSIYAAIYLSGMVRTLLVYALSFLLSGVFFFFRNSRSWARFARWMRSAAGALFLFASLGAGGIPGLKCIDNFYIAFGVLLLGIFLNLVLGILGGSQYFASMHAFLSLSALAVAPQNTVTLIIACVITLVAIATGFRTKWEFHLLVSTASFFVFNVYWRFGEGFTAGGSDGVPRIAGLVTVVAVNALALAFHYRDMYKTSRFELLPFIAHLASWTFLSGGLLIYSTSSRWDTAPLVFAAVLVFLFARHAKKIGIRWLYMTDLLVGESIMLYSILTFARWEIDAPYVAIILFIQTIIFLYIIRKEAERVVSQFATGFQHITLIGIYFECLDKIVSNQYGGNIKYALLSGIVAVVGSAFYSREAVIHGERIDSLDSYFSKVPHGTLSIGALLSPFAVCFMYGFLFFYDWGMTAAASAALVVLVFRQRSRSKGASIGSFAMMVILVFVTWIDVDMHSYSFWKIILRTVPLLVPILFGIIWNHAALPRRSKCGHWIYLLGSLVAIILYYARYTLFVFFSGGSALLCGLIFFEAGRILSNRYKDALRERGDPDRFLLHLAYYAFAVYFLYNFLYGSVCKSIFDGEKFKVIPAASAFAVFMYCSMAHYAKRSIVHASWRVIRPLMFEAALLVAITGIIAKVKVQYLPISWVVYALILFVTGKFVKRIARAGAYSVILFWVSIFHAAYILWFKYDFSTEVVNSVWIAGVIALVLQSAYSYFYWRSPAETYTDYPSFAKLLRILSPERSIIRNCFVLYPLTASFLFVPYQLFRGVSPFVSGVLWLLLAVLSIEGARKLGEKRGKSIRENDTVDEWAFFSGVMFVVAFIIRFFLVYIQSESYVGVVSMRFAIALFAIIVCIYCAFVVPAKKRESFAGWKIIHPLLWETALGLCVTLVLIEVPFLWTSCAWGVASLVFLIAGALLDKIISRFRFYSLVFHWVTLFILVFLLAGYTFPSVSWTGSPAFAGAVSILIQFMYIALFYNASMFEKILLPAPLLFLRKLIDLTSKWKNLAVYYPLFISTAVFVHAAFAPWIYTLLWVAESFAIFVLSVLLRENNFRYLSMLVLGGCLVRLLVVDLAHSGTIVKGLVFICVGLIMLAMNVIYNKYKTRFAK